ncbi:MAG: vWA domain-containing protein [Clostridium sp.]|uniref:vWA domain-containing protein n=1 Tax=Clostridium sp. TaxID=1506 RepID=UPI0030474456
MSSKLNYKVLLSISLIVCIGVTLIVQSSISAEAQVPTKPSFDVKINPLSPNPAKVGEDIRVSGVITPKPFETEVPEKEIVLVLDVSGSMAEEAWIGKDCMERRVKYCIQHNKSKCEDEKCDWDRDGDGWECDEHGGMSSIKPTGPCEKAEHKWVEDYCELHKLRGVHGTVKSTRIYELKKAANSFVDKMKAVPNLKIGIVTYESTAQIRKVDGASLIPSSNVEGLSNIINNLDANGGTNTGEGLRRATYLLSNSNEQDKNANKTVVLMSDGIPTFYTREKVNNNYYMDITEEYGGRSYDSGGGNSDTYDFKDLGYAKAIGEIIKEKGYNGFTIGYGMNSDGNDRMNQIHNSMSDDKENFFPTSDGAIDKVFQQIADKILDSYPITNVSMDLNFTTDFNLAIGGNNISLPNITYEKAKGTQNNGKVRYEAKSVEFEFIIKGKTSGDYNIFENAQATFPWQDEIIIVDNVNMVPITILSNDLPNIEAKLMGDEVKIASINEELPVTYEISPQPFNYNAINNGKNGEDIVVIVDTTTDSKGNGNEWDKTRESFNKIIVEDYMMKQNNVRVAIIPFDGKGIVNNIQKLTGDSQVVKAKINNLTATGDSDGNIEDAIIKADEILRLSAKTTKSIVMVTFGDVLKSDYTNKLKNLKDNEYNIFTTYVSKDKKENDTNIKNVHGYLHNDLDKVCENYIYNYGNNGNETHEGIMIRLKDRLKNGSSISKYVFTDVKLYFNIGEELKVVSGLGSINNISSNYVLNLPEIKYVYKDGAYIYEDSVGKPNSFEVSFVIKPLEYGEHRFKTKNEIVYNNLVGKPLNKGIITPTIIVQDNIEHGIYGGYDAVKKEYVIYPDEKILAKESTVTFAGRFKVYNNKANIQLQVDKNISIDGVPKIYKFDSQGKLTYFKDMVKSQEDAHKYIYQLVENVEKNETLIILYNTVLTKDDPSDTRFENIIYVDKASKAMGVKVGQDSLPDLF